MIFVVVSHSLDDFGSHRLVSWPLSCFDRLLMGTGQRRPRRSSSPLQSSAGERRGQGALQVAAGGTHGEEHLRPCLSVVSHRIEQETYNHQRGFLHLCCQYFILLVPHCIAPQTSNSSRLPKVRPRFPSLATHALLLISSTGNELRILAHLITTSGTIHPG